MTLVIGSIGWMKISSNARTKMLLGWVKVECHPMNAEVNPETSCPNCGRRLPAGVLSGLCPACLLAHGAETQTATGGASPRMDPPSLAEVIRLFPQLEILGLLGAGGMGAVYRARQPALDRQVALKLLPASAEGGPRFAERFNREARALARLNHPNIVAVHEFGQVEGRHYFLMEFVDGANLRQLERSGRLSPREALQIIPQICDALQYAHDEGVVHRDIKPENVLVDRRGRVKIADFGLAKILDANVETHRLTAEGQVMGTPHYMAPEQFERPLTVDHRADIYSLGVVFYEMLTGDLPLGKFAPPSRKLEVDVRLDEVVLRALENDPERRYQRASDVKSQVETIAVTPAPAGESAPTPAPAATQQPKHVRRPWSLWVIGLLLILSGLHSAYEVGSGIHQHQYSFDFGVLTLPMGIGLLRLRPWWRKATLGYFGVLLVAIGVSLPLLFLGFLNGNTETTVHVNSAFWPSARSLAPGSFAILYWLTATLLVAACLWLIWTLRQPRIRELFLARGFHRPWLEWAALVPALLVPYFATVPRSFGPVDFAAWRDPQSHSMVANFLAGGRLELRAVNTPGALPATWWHPDSAPATNSFEVRGLASSLSPSEQRASLVFQISGIPAGTGVPSLECIPAGSISAGGRVWQNGNALKDGWAMDIAWPATTRKTTVRLGYPVGNWRAVVTHPVQGGDRVNSSEPGDPVWNATLNHVRDDGTNLFLTLVLGPDSSSWKRRVVVVDTDGQTHLQQEGSGSTGEGNSTWTLTFPGLTRARAKEIQMQVQRVFWVEFRDLVLPPGSPATSKLPVKFGMEQEVSFSDVLDLDTGRTGRLPGESIGPGGLAGVGRDVAWMQDQGFDILLGAGKLEFLGVAAVNLRPSAWDGMAPLDVLRGLDQQATARSELVQESLPVTFAYRTREGGMGLARWMSVAPDGQKATLQLKRIEFDHAR